MGQPAQEVPIRCPDGVGFTEEEPCGCFNIELPSCKPCKERCSVVEGGYFKLALESKSQYWCNSMCVTCNDGRKIYVKRKRSASAKRFPGL